MKKFNLTLLLAVFLVFGVKSQELPQPSPYAEVMQRVGLTDVTVKYSRPGVKGRTIFGGLEAYGEIWRTGANSSTKIILSSDAKVGGVEVKAGTYSVFTIPGEKEWKLMLNSELGATENSYKEENNVAEITMSASESDMTESMLFYFDNVKDESADLVFKWEKVKWMVSIQVESNALALKNIEDKMKSMQDFRAYNSSARYYLDHDQDLEQALAWSKKSVEIEKTFWNVYTLSLIYNKMGNKKMAIQTAEMSLKMAEEANYQPYVKMNKENIANWK